MRQQDIGFLKAYDYWFEVVLERSLLLGFYVTSRFADVLPRFPDFFVTFRIISLLLVVLGELMLELLLMVVSVRLKQRLDNFAINGNAGKCCVKLSVYCFKRNVVEICFDEEVLGL